ncbi:hypothetical protein NFI96_000423 [Prochilodus magdalenae]|nr:hypothetical protein NFI96_000423 [Prochilodus magdalenae]
MVPVVTLVPALCRSFIRSLRVGLGFLLTVLRIIWTPLDEILRGAPGRGSISGLELNMNSSLPYSLSLVPSALVMSIHLLSFLLGLPLNVYIIVLLFPRRGVMEASDVFSWNQAVSEIVFVLFGPVHTLCRLSYSLCIYELFGLLIGISSSSRCLFQSCVCLEWYLAVVHPVTFLRYKPLRYRVGCSVAVWMCSLAMGVIYSSMLLSLPFVVFAVVYLVALMVDGFCCVSILRRLREPGPGDMERDAGEMDAAKKKAFQVVSVNLLAFLLQNVPVSVAYGFQNVLSQYVFDEVAVFGLMTNTVAGLFQSVYALHRAEQNRRDLTMNSTLTTSTSLVFPALIISSHVLNFLLGLPLNVYIIVLLFPGRGGMDSADVFSWNQAISEIFFVLFGPFHALCVAKPNLCIYEPFGFFFGISSSSRCLFQSCVCLEWYLAVVHPVTFLRYKPLRYRVACSIAVWMCSLAMGVIYSCMLRNLPFVVFAVVHLIALVVDGFCCVSILRKLRNPGPRDMERDAGEMDTVKKKAFQVVSVNLLTFLLQNIPLPVAYGFQKVLSRYVFDVVSVFGMVTNTVTGLFQSAYSLYRAGKLPIIQSTSFTSCCFSSGRG